MLENSWGLSFNSSLTTVLIVVILTLIIKKFINKCQRDPRLVKFAETLPGPRPVLPILGNCWVFLLYDYAEQIQKYEQKYGSRFRLWFGKHLVAIITDTDDIKTVFDNTTKFGKPEIFVEAYEEIYGMNIFTSPKPIWKTCRRQLAPFFARKNLVQKFEDINKIIHQYTKEMETFAGGPAFDVLQNILTDLTFDIITKTLYGFQISKQEKAELGLEFPGKTGTAETIVMQKIVKPWERWRIVDYFKYKEANDSFRKQSTKFVNLILDRQSKEPPLKPEAETETVKSSFLQTIIELQKNLKLDPNYVKNEASFITGTGSDAPPFLLAQFLLAVASNHEIQDKLYEELYRRFGDEERDGDFSDLDRLPYMDQVLNECIRLFATGLFFYRSVEEDVTLGPYTYPAGTTIAIPTSNMHLNPKYYPNPLKFNPDNFSPEAVSKRPRTAFFTFGAGPRDCLGRVLAELEIKLILIAVLRKFKLGTDADMNYMNVLTPEGATRGYKIKIEVRK